MSPASISLYALAAIVGVGPVLLRATLTRAGVRLGPNERASEDDLVRVFGMPATRSLLERSSPERGNHSDHRRRRGRDVGAPHGDIRASDRPDLDDDAG